MNKLLKDREIRDILVGRIEDTRDSIAGRSIITEKELVELKQELHGIINLIDELKK